MEIQFRFTIHQIYSILMYFVSSYFTSRTSTEIVFYYVDLLKENYVNIDDDNEK